MSDAAIQQQARQQIERRSGLSESELDLLATRLWAKFEQHFENLGWDVSTPKSRDRIRANNRWVDEWRTSADKAKTAAVHAGIIAFISGLIVLAWQAFKNVVAKAG